MNEVRRTLAIAAAAAIAAQPLAAQGRSMRATGTFDVRVLPQADSGFDVGRMTIEKQFHGDIEGTGTGMMLSFRNGALSSGGYVAMEKVVGTVHGKRGTFFFQHNTTMVRGQPAQSVNVVPDSGTEELTGIRGHLVIIIEGKKHSYEFEYTIAKP